MSVEINKLQHPELWGIVAMGKDGAIGRNNDMPWHLPEDLRHFKAITMGHPVIMGRRTWESLPKKPLPGRLNIVITRNPEYHADGALTASSLEAALSLLPQDAEAFIIGGGRLYTSSLPMISRLYITRIDMEAPDADTFFPSLPTDQWKLTECEGPLESKSGLKYSFEVYERTDHK